MKKLPENAKFQDFAEHNSAQGNLFLFYTCVHIEHTHLLQKKAMWGLKHGGSTNSDNFDMLL